MGKKFLPPKVRRPRESLQLAVAQIEGPMCCLVAGSYRREKDTIGDLDCLVPPDVDIGQVVEDFTTSFNYDPIRSGPLKSEGVCIYDGWPLLINLWKVPLERAWAGMLLFATGPMDLNVMMRACAKGREWKLSQYGLFNDEGHQVDKGDTEEQIFKLLDLPYLTPPERENWREHEFGVGDRIERKIKVESSSGDTYYDVTLKNGKATMCTCKGFVYRSKCRHLKEAEEVYAFLNEGKPNA